jgi:hypothetical protein
MADQTLYDALAANPTIQVDLLSAIPASSDRSTWSLAPWSGYLPQTTTLLTQAVGGPVNGLCWDFTIDFFVPSGSWPINAVALSLAGIAFAVAYVSWTLGARQIETVRLGGQLYPQL